MLAFHIGGVRAILNDKDVELLVLCADVMNEQQEVHEVRFAIAPEYIEEFMRGLNMVVDTYFSVKSEGE
jgi:hypothetical protein